MKLQLGLYVWKSQNEQLEKQRGSYFHYQKFNVQGDCLFLYDTDEHFEARLRNSTFKIALTLS